MSALEVLQTVAVLRPDEFGVVSRDVLIGQNDIGVALSSNQDFSSDQWKDVLLSILSNPIQLRCQHAFKLGLFVRRRY